MPEDTERFYQAIGRARQVSNPVEDPLRPEFLRMEADEKVVVIEEIDQRYINRGIPLEWLLDRPFYGRILLAGRDEQGRGWYHGSMRCVIRREEIAPVGVLGIGGTRSIRLDRVRVMVYQSSDLPRLYQEWVERTSPAFRDLPSDFSSDIVPDREDLMEKRKVVGLHFWGLWMPDVNYNVDKFAGAFFVRLEQRSRSGRYTIVMYFCDENGDRLPEGSVLKLFGDSLTDGIHGYIQLEASVDPALPFDRGTGGTIFVRT